MIPIKLKLCNFTSYGANVPELDFTSFHLAAISGQNGAGKSSLLDSITWCLWGSSRLGDSSDQLIKIGQIEMRVEFSFELDGHIYTVKRKRNLKSGGSTTLELFAKSHNLTEGTIKATQQKIIDTLHLTYETFVNSAFIRQGHADEFTTKGPTDRKKILADILGLGNYDALEEKAKEKAKEAQTKLQLLEYQVLEIEAELSQKEQREKELSEAESEVKVALHQLKEVELEIKAILAEKETVTTKLKTLEEKQSRIKLAEEEIQELILQILEKQKLQTDYQSVLSKKSEIEQGYQELFELREKKKGLDEKRSELIKLKDELVLVQKKLREREDNRNKAVTDLEKAIEKYLTEKNTLDQQNNHLKTHKDSCPTCGQTIGEATNKQIISQNQAKIDKLDKKIAELDNKKVKYLGIILPEQKAVKEKEREVKDLENQAKTYQVISDQVNKYSTFENLNTKLQQAQAASQTNSSAIEDLQKISESKQKEMKKDKTELSELDSLRSLMSKIRERLSDKEILKEELSRRSAQLNSQVGAAKQLVSRVEQLEKILKEKNADKSKLKEEKSIFEELALAFGKKGIQAMIIENAVPEIENEANQLLGKLTDGRMKVSFQTQKETKSGTTQETLDIIISDEMGERAYEAYSGGEQFRVNFAIRLALSKLLTHRAGSKLQFLVIDEGFGTQDAQGRSRIVEALDIIQDDFAKIVIITHLDELKEEFPIRIEVEKGPEGSTFQLLS